MAEIERYPNIQRYRKAKGISIKHMVEKTGLSINHYKNIESGNVELHANELGVISDVLDVRENKLIYPIQELQSEKFRSNKKLKNRKLIILDAEHWLSEYNFIEKLLKERLSNPLDKIIDSVKGKKEAQVEAAVVTREKFGVGDEEVISNICGLLEANGIKVGENVVESHDFFGLSVGADDGGPAIIVNKWNQIPVERWIFTAAHELGHLVLHRNDFDVQDAKENKVLENEANAFASEFLMPDGLFVKEWSDNYGLPFVERVITVKRIFRVSYKTVLYRLTKHFPNSKNIWARFYSDYKKIQGKSLLGNVEPEALAKDAFGNSCQESSTRAEPVQLSPADFKNGRLVSLVRKAIENELISFGRGAEILQISIQEFRELANTWYC